jgi:hypothetical protein
MARSPLRPQRSSPQSLTIPGRVISDSLSGNELPGRRQDELTINTIKGHFHPIYVGVR